ncbi:MAG: RNA polymerase sporulation sigma factor SigH, partial [Ruminiclostridium sp.]|nr:RNA polymerase sporulation sigma factor SigH [Ruminiclostridium sp.]
MPEFKTEQYLHLEDEEIVQLGRKGDKDATDYLIHKYKNLVR